MMLLGGFFVRFWNYLKNRFGKIRESL